MQEWGSCSKLLQLYWDRDIEKNPGPPIYVDPSKTIAALYSQDNELALGQNVGQQCVAMSLCSLLLLQYHIGESADCEWSCANNKYRNLFYSSLSQLTRQAFIMQSELPTALHVFDTDYQLEYSESYSGTVHQETTVEGDQYCPSLWRAFELHISENYTYYIITLRCIAVTTYCNSNVGFKIVDSCDLYGRGQPQDTSLLLKVLSLDSFVHYFSEYT